MAYPPLTALENAKAQLDCLSQDNIKTQDLLRYIMPTDSDVLKNFLKTGTKTAKLIQFILTKDKTPAKEINGILLSLCNLYGWMQNKQVYQPDKDFLELLLQTPLLSFNYKSLRNMPYPNIYIDISSMSPIVHGAFVYISEIDAISLIDIILVKNDNNLEHSSFVINHTEMDYRLTESPKLGISQEIMTIWQTFLYLCSENANVEKNPETEKTYRPGRIIRNRFSEIRKWDVGIRIGSNIRRYKAAVVQDDEKRKSEKEGAVRKRPRPHMRRAHWHRYMTGKGRTVPVIKWIEPVFVLAHDSEDMPVTIHPMT